MKKKLGGKANKTFLGFAFILLTYLAKHVGITSKMDITPIVESLTESVVDEYGPCWSLLDPGNF